MTHKLEQWIKDAEAFEIATSFNTSTTFRYEFRDRYDDFYITLLNSFYDVLCEVKDGDYTVYADKLHKLAEGMIIYSEQTSAGYFEGVNLDYNHLYVATIYFLTGYETVSTYLLRGYDVDRFANSSSAQIIYYIVSGGAARIDSINESFRDIAKCLRDYILKGTGESLKSVIDYVEQKNETFSYRDLDDFFDTNILYHVLLKYSKHNLWNFLNTYEPKVDWHKYIEHSKKNRILSFLPSQEDAIQKGLLSFEKSFSLKMPTSAGKTYITELVIFQELQKNAAAKILYLAPLRSLSRELKEHFSKVSHNLGFNMRAIYGGSSYTLDQSLIDDAELLISTPETFMSMEEMLDDQLQRFSLIICDEGQLLDSMSRGIPYELLLSRLKKHEGIRFLFLSAIIPNISEVNTWLGGLENQVADKQYRPCPIKFATLKVKKRDTILTVKAEDYKTDKFLIPQFLTKEEIGDNQYGNLNDSAALAAVKSSISGPVLLFTARKHGKHGCEEIGQKVMKVIDSATLPSLRGMACDLNKLDMLKEYVAYQLGDNHSLCQFIERGFAYHHGSLPQNIRELIEEYYNNKILPLLICTTTLAEGVNLPVHTIVLTTLSRYDFRKNRGVTLDATEIKNIIGRAGRAGRQKYGVVILPNARPNTEAYKNLIKALRNEGLRNIRGTLYDVVQYIEREDWTDEQIKQVLNLLSFNDAIDTMIAKSTDVDDIDALNIESIIENCLAYHVGSQDIRNKLAKVFEIRLSVLKDKVQSVDFKRYHKSGMGVSRFEYAKIVLTEEKINEFLTFNIESDEWLSYIVSFILDMPDTDIAQIKTLNETESRNITKDELKILISQWINGYQYYEISNSLNVSVDMVLDLVLYLQGVFHLAASALIRYVESLNDDIPTEFSVWLDMLKYGVNTQEKLLLIKCGMTDRIAVNSIVNFALIENCDTTTSKSLRASLQNDPTFMTVIDQLEIPKLCKENVKKQLGL